MQAAGAARPVSPEIHPDRTVTFRLSAPKATEVTLNAELQRDGSRYDNLLFVAGPESDLWEFKEVPHGTVSAVWYRSPTLKQERWRMVVYTAPGYESSQTRYPVLYLLHGGGGDEDAWITMGCAAIVMDNLLAQSKAKPFLVVMPNDNATQTVSQDFGFGPTPVRQSFQAPPPPPGCAVRHAAATAAALRRFLPGEPG